MILDDVIPMLIREVDKHVKTVTGFFDTHDLPMVNEEDFAKVEPFQMLTIDQVDCYVRCYGEESTILRNSNLYDLKFLDSDKVYACIIDGIAVLVGTRKYSEFTLDEEVHQIKLG